MSSKIFAAAPLLLLLDCHGESPTSPIAQPPPRPPLPAVVAGTVYSPSGMCLAGAVVEVLDAGHAGERLVQTECGGYWDGAGPGYTLPLPSGTSVRLRASMQGYRSKEETFIAKPDATGEANFTLEPE